MSQSGPLAGMKMVEFAGIGPAPMCAMLLADLGAEIITIDRLEPSGNGIPRPAKFDILRRGRRSVALDLKQPEGVDCALELIAKADALIEGFRPGTMERIGLSPETCFTRNPRLVYGRMTGWGQSGPLAHAAGHDLNYIALSGALAAIGRKGAPPTIPLNLVGDFGGGGMLLAFGIACALLETSRSGRGQVVDAAMAEGASTLFSAFFGLSAAGLHSLERGDNLLDSGAPHYEVYQCADGKWITVAPIEQKFRDILLQKIGFDPLGFPDVSDKQNWSMARDKLKERFSERSQAEWCDILEGTDACFAPMLNMLEAPDHPHHRARGAFIELEGVVQPAPAPRFSRTRSPTPLPSEPPGASGDAVLRRWGIPEERIRALHAAGITPAL